MPVYTKEFYSDDYVVRTAESAEEIVNALWPLLHPSSVVDLGCGIGLFLAAFSTRGIKDICGVDGEWAANASLRITKEQFLSLDLCHPVNLNRRFDLALCLEVAEHLPRESATTIVDSLVNLAPVVLFSAAIPNQGGYEHLNEQWPHYWTALFSKRDYLPIDCVRPRIWDNERVLWWYAQNAILFVSKDHLETEPALTAEMAKCSGRPLDLVHPRAFDEHHRGASAPKTEAVALRTWLSHGRHLIRQRLSTRFKKRTARI